MAAGKGKALLALIGVKPKGGAPPPRGDGDDGGDDGAAAPDADGYAPDPDTVDAAQKAIDAFHADDAKGFASAMCALIDAHQASKG